MFKDLAKRAGAGVAAAILLGIAAGTTFVAAAFAIYAGFKMVVTPAAASALTALIAVIVTGLIAFIASKIAGGGDRKDRHEHHHESFGLGSAVQIGSFVVPILLEFMKGRREKQTRKRLKKAKR